MGAISIFKLDSPSASCQSYQLMAEADSHYRYLRGFHDFAKVINSILTVSGIPRAVADENAIKADQIVRKVLSVHGKRIILRLDLLVCNFVYGIVVRESCHTCTPTHETAEDVWILHKQRPTGTSRSTHSL